MRSSEWGCQAKSRVLQEASTAHDFVIVYRLERLLSCRTWQLATFNFMWTHAQMFHVHIHLALCAYALFPNLSPAPLSHQLGSEDVYHVTSPVLLLPLTQRLVREDPNCWNFESAILSPLVFDVQLLLLVQCICRHYMPVFHYCTTERGWNKQGCPIKQDFVFVAAKLCPDHDTVLLTAITSESTY